MLGEDRNEEPLRGREEVKGINISSILVEMEILYLGSKLPPPSLFPIFFWGFTCHHRLQKDENNINADFVLVGLN